MLSARINQFEFSNHSCIFEISVCRDDLWDDDNNRGEIMAKLDFLDNDNNSNVSFSSSGLFNAIFYGSLTDGEIKFLTTLVNQFFRNTDFVYTSDEQQFVGIAA